MLNKHQLANNDNNDHNYDNNIPFIIIYKVSMYEYYFHRRRQWNKVMDRGCESTVSNVLTDERSMLNI